MAKLATEREKLLQAFYAGAVPLDLLKTEQERIARDSAEAGKALSASDLEFEQLEALTDKALELVGSCEGTYTAATPLVRRMFNQAFYKRIIIDEGEVADAELSDPFAQLLASDLAHEHGRRTEDSSFSFGRSSSKSLLVALSGLYSNDNKRELISSCSNY